MANLFEIKREILDAWDAAVDPETGEINEDLLQRFEELQLEHDEKIENIACWVKNLRSDAEQLKAEAEKLRDRAKAAENKADRLQRYLSAALNGAKFETARCAISWRKSVAVNIADDAQIPEEYVVTIETRKPEKAAIKKALQAGEIIPGCELETRNNITIK